MLKIKKEKYDYYCNRDGEPVVTICYILTDNGIVGRGVSVCSEQDKYVETYGKGLAKGHALRAIKGRHIDNFKRSEVIKLLIQCKCPFTKKGERNPELSWWERKFLFGAKKMDKYDCRIGWDVFRFIVDKTTIPSFDMPILRIGEKIIPKKDIEGLLKESTAAALRETTIKARNHWFEKNIYSKLIHQPKGSCKRYSNLAGEITEGRKIPDAPDRGCV